MFKATTWRPRRPAAPILIAVPLAIVGVLPLDGTLQFLTATAMAWAVAAIGLDVFSGYLGQPSFGHAGFVGLGAYSYAIVGKHAAPLPSAAVALLVVAVISAVVGAALVRLRDFGLVLGTFFLSFVVTSVLSGTTFASITEAESGLQVPPMQIGATDMTTGKGYYYLCLVVMLVAIVASSNYVRSGSGRALRLTKRSDVVTRAVGAHPGRVKLAAFVYSAVLAAAAGVLIADGAGYIAPENFTAQQSIILFAMVAVGGQATIAGPILGALLYTVTPNYLQVAKTYQDVVFAVLLLAALVLFKGGLFGILSAGHHRLVRGLGLSGPRRPVAGGTGEERTQLPGSRTHRAATLDAVDLRVDYGGVHALDGATMSVGRGVTHALVGPNGAGKTTLLNCVSALEPRLTGTVRVDGRPVSTRANPVGRTFQNPSLVSDLSVLENVMLGGYATQRTRLLGDLLGLGGRKDAVQRTRAGEALKFVGLAADRHLLLPGELSFGEAKLVDIARAVMTDAGVLVMDEPTAGLSGAEMALVSDLLGDLRGRLTVLVVSHHVGWVSSVAESVTVLASGRVIAVGDPRAVFKDPAVREVFVGEPTGHGETRPAPIPEIEHIR